MYLLLSVIILPKILLGLFGGSVGKSHVPFPIVSFRIFIDLINPSGRTMDLGSTQPLTEMSTRVIFWRKGGGGVKVAGVYG